MILQSDEASSKKIPIQSWSEFERVRASKSNLLKRLDDFPNSILVTGCQRSGTTMLARILTMSEGMTNYWFGRDDELDAALILSGQVEHRPQGRYCFQTTYVDDRYFEYYQHFNGHKIIWVIRNPFSVVYSLLYNWPKRAFNASFHRCALPLLPAVKKWTYKISGGKTINAVHQACLIYNSKLSHLFDLREHIGVDQLMIVDYDNLVIHKEQILSQIYRFVDLDYKSEYANQIHSQSLNKRNQLSEAETTVVTHISKPIYLKAKRMVDQEHASL